MDNPQSATTGEVAPSVQDFVVEVAHLLRTPLTSVRGFASTLLARWSELNEVERLAFVTRIDAKSSEMSALINRMFDLWETRNDAGAATDAPGADLGLEVLHAIEDLAITLRSHHLRLEVEPGTMVLADAEALRQVIENLLVNARNCSPPGSTIKIVARDFGNDRVVLSIHDEGEPVAPADRDRIFHGAYDGLGRRAGADLVAVKRLCEEQGGKVWVESWPGHGTVFSFTLKRRAPLAQMRADLS